VRRDGISQLLLDRFDVPSHHAVRLRVERCGACVLKNTKQTVAVTQPFCQQVFIRFAQLCYRTFSTIPVKTVNSKRCFSKLKITSIKNYYRNAIGQQRLHGVAVILTESAAASELSFHEIMGLKQDFKERFIYYLY
jgi:hypothetical protein